MEGAMEIIALSTLGAGENHFAGIVLL